MEKASFEKPAEVSVRKMEKSDVKALAEIERECFSLPWSENALETELSNENAVFLVAEIEGEVCGYIGAHTVVDEAYIANVAVSGSFRRRGVGESLVRACCDKVKALGCSFISLEVRVSNEKAIALYEKTGFVPLGERKNFYSSPTENALIMTKNF